MISPIPRGMSRAPQGGRRSGRGYPSPRAAEVTIRSARDDAWARTWAFDDDEWRFELDEDRYAEA